MSTSQVIPERRVGDVHIYPRELMLLKSGFASSEGLCSGLMCRLGQSELWMALQSSLARLALINYARGV